MDQYELIIPLERVAVLVGKKGYTKRKIQKLLNIKLEIDSKDGDVIISGEDSVNLIIAQDVVKAVGRGFNPEIALELIDDTSVFELIDISDYCKTKKDIIRLRGRSIGEKGKCRELISQLTNVEISIYGKTIGIIGKLPNVDLAKRGFDKLLKGSSHGKVFSFLEKEAKKLRINL